MNVIVLTVVHPLIHCRNRTVFSENLQAGPRCEAKCPPARACCIGVESGRWYRTSSAQSWKFSNAFGVFSFNPASMSLCTRPPCYDACLCNIIKLCVLSSWSSLRFSRAAMSGAGLSFVFPCVCLVLPVEMIICAISKQHTLTQTPQRNIGTRLTMH